MLFSKWYGYAIYQRSEVTNIRDINHDTTGVTKIPAEASALPSQLHLQS